MAYPNPLLPFGPTLTPQSPQPQQPRGIGDRIQGILGTLLNAQDGNVSRGLIDFGSRMLQHSAPGDIGTFGGALGASLGGTRAQMQMEQDQREAELKQEAQQAAVGSLLPEELRGLPPQIQNAILMQRMQPEKLQAMNVNPGTVGVFNPSTGEMQFQEAPMPTQPMEAPDLDWQKINDGGRDVLLGLNPQTGAEVVRYSGAEARQMEGLDAADRNQYLAWKKEYGADMEEADTVATATQKLINTSSNPAGDVSLVFAYMKLLDPASTVREGEQATARNAGGVPAWVRSQYNRVTGGGELDDAMRQQFKDEGIKVASAYTQKVDDTMQYYRNTMSELGMNPDIVITRDPLSDIREDLQRVARGTNPMTGR